MSFVSKAVLKKILHENPDPISRQPELDVIAHELGLTLEKLGAISRDTYKGDKGNDWDWDECRDMMANMLLRKHIKPFRSGALITLVLDVHGLGEDEIIAREVTACVNKNRELMRW